MFCFIFLDISLGLVHILFKFILLCPFRCSYNFENYQNSVLNAKIRANNKYLQAKHAKKKTNGFISCANDDGSIALSGRLTITTVTLVSILGEISRSLQTQTPPRLMWLSYMLNRQAHPRFVSPKPNRCPRAIDFKVN